MKRIYYILTALVAAMTFSSCEDFLTKVPKTALSPDSFFITASDLELWTNKFYSDLLEETDIAETFADDMMGSSLSALQKGTRTTSSKSWSTPSVNSDGYISSNGTFTPLMNINYFLEHSSNCQDEAVREKYNGVAYFFRAYFYYKMVRQYGDMPWYDYVIGSADAASLNKPRDPRGYVMMKVLEDCDKAYERLPEAWAAGPLFHVSKNAAMALKARAALFEGTFRKYHAGTPYVPNDEETYDGKTVSSQWFLEQAVEAAKTIMGKKSLYTGSTMGLAPIAKNASYREFFVLEDADPNETILGRAYRSDEAVTVRHGIQFDMKNGKRSATQRFVNHYLKKDGTAYTETELATMEFSAQFQNRDPRLAQTIHGPNYVAVAETAHETLDWERTLNGYRVIKYISDASHEGATTSTSDFALFRYAEVLLNYAEAKAELGTLTDADVAATIDLIRDRVGMAKMGKVPTTVDPVMEKYYPNAKGAQKAAILEIRRERTVELCFEGFRQWDLLRWKEGKWLTPASTKGFQGIYLPGLGEYDLDKDGKIDICVYQGTKPSTTAPSSNVLEIGKNWTLTEGTKGNLTYYASENYTWDEGKDYLWPIPEDQRQITNGALSQNPGWSDGL
ncbi:MAG: RagB/SusD family nutrient uptake outer membrane protein [Bacteroidales bacterium]|nr:RagB/SusD family nutrient uptake outer membrane protein [Bacteroidales bacterium]